MGIQHPYRKLIAKVCVAVFIHFIVAGYYLPRARAQENLIITGFQVKTPAFKPYREEGQVSFFLNMDASMNVEIVDKEFNLIRTLDLMGKGVPGENVITWDGKNEHGGFIKSGEYIFSITAQADNGRSAIISKDVAIELVAPDGTEFKPHITEIEGKPKKEYPIEIPTKTVPIFGWGDTCLRVPCIPICLFFNIMDRSYRDINYYLALKTIPDKDILKKTDEYNAEIDAEIAQRNREIDEYNDKVKDSIVIMMKVVE